MEKYYRKGFKWAKVSGHKGKWYVALGWKSNHTASRINTTPNKTLAETIARNWVRDQ